eukprot:m.30944 g.30944  ORF g.30944 m.30944 type:complete len:143 (+) comp10650_c0_seq1:63-491(+)
MSEIRMCVVGEEVQGKLKKFRFRKEKNNAAIIMKIDIKDTPEVVICDEMEDCTLEEVAAELPEFNPRFIAFSYCYTHPDGRMSFPLCFIYYSPHGVKPESAMVYSSSKTRLVQELGITKVFDVRHADELTQSFLEEKLAFFR